MRCTETSPKIDVVPPCIIAVPKPRTAAESSERRAFHFLDAVDPRSPPHFLPLPASPFHSVPAPDNWRFDPALLRDCVARTEAWKRQHGFPEDVAGILIDLAQRETKTFSVQFAHKLVATMKRTVRLHKEPIKSAGFRVLRAPDVPSVLVELGYVSNKEDLQSLLSEGWRERTADSMASAIDGFFSTNLAGARTGSN